MHTYTIGGKKGKKVNLNESENRIVVRTKNARPLNDAIAKEESKEILKDYDVEMEFPEADVTVLKARVDKPNNKEKRDKAREVLKTEPELRFAGRVLEDEKSKSPVVYTENIFVKFHDDVTAAEYEKILTELELTMAVTMDKNTFIVKPAEKTGLKVFEIAQALLEKEEVELCHPELIRKKSHKAIHPKQWHLHETTIGGKKIKAHANVERAHEITRGKNVVIAIIDDGVDIDHPEFNKPGKVVSSRDISSNSNDPRPKYSDDHHGTQCAGVAVARGLVACGVAPDAKLMPIRLREDIGCYSEGLAFKWALDHGADIISCSWGPMDGPWWDPEDDLHFEEYLLPDSTRYFIDKAVNQGRNGKGCVIFFSAGNGNEDVKNDGYISYEKVIAVAACNDRNKKSVYSDFGDSIWCAFPSGDYGDEDMDHPEPLTSGIFTTDKRGLHGLSRNDYISTFGGTSSACPGAAATAALMLSVNPDLTWQEVRDIIKDTCVKIDQTNGDYDANGHSPFYGYGKIDAEKAVLRAIAFKVMNNVVQKNVRIHSAIVDPVGADMGNERLSLMNVSTSDINLTGWAIEVKGQKQVLSTTLGVGQKIVIDLVSPLKLANSGATIVLIDDQEQVIDAVSYGKDQVDDGIEIQFV